MKAVIKKNPLIIEFFSWLTSISTFLNEFSKWSVVTNTKVQLNISQYRIDDIPCLTLMWLGKGRGVILLRWSYSGTVKAVSLAFCSINFLL